MLQRLSQRDSVSGHQNANPEHDVLQTLGKLRFLTCLAPVPAVRDSPLSTRLQISIPTGFGASSSSTRSDGAKSLSATGAAPPAGHAKKSTQQYR